MTAKLTKEINLVTLSLDRKQKIIYALSFNWYRHKLALKYNIPNFKPVILFRRKFVEESNDDFEYFFEVVENLELNDLSFLRRIFQKILMLVLFMNKVFQELKKFIIY